MAKVLDDEYKELQDSLRDNDLLEPTMAMGNEMQAVDRELGVFDVVWVLYDDRGTSYYWPAFIVSTNNNRVDVAWYPTHSGGKVST